MVLVSEILPAYAAFGGRISGSAAALYEGIWRLLERNGGECWTTDIEIAMRNGASWAAISPGTSC